jgi:segregation and condensation protein B
MISPHDDSELPDADLSDDLTDDQGISLEELSESFAQLIGEDKPPPATDTESDVESSADDADETELSLDDQCPTTPKTILEAMLFVGHPSNEPLTSRMAASLVRGVSPTEIDELVRELNEDYEATMAPYRVVSAGAGYRLALLSKFEGLRERFYGRIRQTRLSQSAIDILALVAYNQPISKDRVNELRQKPSGAILTQLVRRQLLEIERVDTKPRQTLYRTTPRFLELFGIETLEDLPRSQEMDK